MTSPHRHRSFSLSGWTCTASACGKLQAAGINPSYFTRQELVLLWFLLPPGRLVIAHDLVPVVSLSAHGLDALVSRTRKMLEPQDFTIMQRKGMGYALVRVPRSKRNDNPETMEPS
jgi:hypothetical protein